MPWITLTIDDLNDARAGALVTAMRTKALAEGQSDPSPRVIQMVVDEIRRCIAFAQQTPLETDPTTIPQGLREMAAQKIIRVMKARLLQALTDDEKTAEQLYQKRLEQLTRAEWPVDKPATPLDPSPVNASLTGYFGSDTKQPL
ncbi:hypothetical protein [Opitutus sp. ER46]|uniref:hypothetical protein n=1 Tax=Opitutus sp. ER46 TaxID=2161864 RepID=UPI000D322A20|nr:hypothetical protein [Opitutus sp. ER46]PTX95763.1 hypothetical protein DB354_10150 [Opitutus sp. ER46]